MRTAGYPPPPSAAAGEPLADPACGEARLLVLAVGGGPTGDAAPCPGCGAAHPVPPGPAGPCALCPFFDDARAWAAEVGMEPVLLSATDAALDEALGQPRGREADRMGAGRVVEALGVCPWPGMRRVGRALLGAGDAAPPRANGGAAAGDEDERRLEAELEAEIERELAREAGDGGPGGERLGVEAELEAELAREMEEHMGRGGEGAEVERELLADRAVETAMREDGEGGGDEEAAEVEGLLAAMAAHRARMGAMTDAERRRGAAELAERMAGLLGGEEDD